MTGKAMTRTLITVTTLGVVIAATVPAFAADDAGKRPKADFNRDGHDDLAIGTPYKDIGGVDQAGIVSVLPGAIGGSSANNSYWYQGTGGVQGGYETGDRFGYALAAIPRGDATFRDGFASGNLSAWN